MFVNYQVVLSHRTKRRGGTDRTAQSTGSSNRYYGICLVYFLRASPQTVSGCPLVIIRPGKDDNLEACDISSGDRLAVVNSREHGRDPAVIFASMRDGEGSLAFLPHMLLV